MCFLLLTTVLKRDIIVKKRGMHYEKTLEKAIDVATNLMIAQIRAQPYGHAESQSHEVAKFYIALVKDLVKEFENIETD